MFAHPHTVRCLHVWPLDDITENNWGVFAGVCLVPFHCWGNRLRTGIVSTGETQRQVENTGFSSSGFKIKNHSVCVSPQVSKEAGTDLLCLPQPGRDERRGRSAIQLAAHAEEAHSERRLRGEPRL